MIFLELLYINNDLSKYANSKNIFKRIYRYFIYRKLRTLLKEVHNIPLDITILSEFILFACKIDSNTISNTYSNELIFKVLNKTLEIRLNYRLNTIYINTSLMNGAKYTKIFYNGIIPNVSYMDDKETLEIVYNIRNLIRNTVDLFMKGM